MSEQWELDQWVRQTQKNDISIESFINPDKWRKLSRHPDEMPEDLWANYKTTKWFIAQLTAF